MATGTNKRNKTINFSPLLPIVVIISCIFFLTTLLYGIHLPFVGYNSWNYTTYSLIAHNYLQYGYDETLFAPVVSVAQLLPDEPVYYLHHPQLLSLLMSGVFFIFGESFLTARIVVVFSVIASLFLLYRIAVLLQGRTYALVVVSVAAVMPGFVLFGKMIGQEALVLFIALLLSYFFLLYERKKSRLLLCMMVITIVFGVLSDWPMVYFSLLVGGFAFFRKMRFVGVILGITAVLSAVGFLGYIYFLTGSFHDLLTALGNRSLGTLLGYHAWPLLWINGITIRILFYFTPVLALCTLSFLYLTARGKYRQTHGLIYVWGMFGILHVLLYPEGSFGHPYWIYYMIPFVIFTSARVIYEYLDKQKMMFVVGFIFFLLFASGVHLWKIKEQASHVFRYELAQQVSQDFPPYKKIMINTDSVIDPDFFAYPLHYQVKQVTVSNVAQSKFSNVYVHTCMGRCDLTLLSPLLSRFAHRLVQTPQAEGILFYLDKSQPSQVAMQPETIATTTTTSKSQKSLFQHFYSFLVDVLHMPQL